MSVPFVPNAGQWDARAAFSAKMLNGTLFVTVDGKLVYSLPATKDQAWSLGESFVSANGTPQEAKPRGQGSAAKAGTTKVSYFVGDDPSRYRAGIATYDRLRLGDVYAGVDVQLRAAGSNVEKIFTVAPQRDPQQIRIRLEGANRLEIGDKGELIARTGNGPVTWTAPIAYQEIAEGMRRDVDVRYVLDNTTQTYGFAVGDYDRSLPLVIDPLLQSTYLGGSGSDAAFAMAIHPRTGDVYVAGSVASATFPQTTGGFATSLSGASDGFISRLSGDLKTLYQSTYLGGTGDDLIRAIAIHPSTFEVYVAGWTTSNPFPFANNSFQSANGGGRDGFLTRIAPDLTAVRQSVFIGGSGDDEVHAMAIHPHTGDIYLAGVSSSPNFPTTAGAAQTATTGGTDAFIVRTGQDFFLSSGSHNSTLLGGAGNDIAYALAIHPRSGDIFVGGITASSDFPGLSAASAQSTKPQFFGGFVTRVDKSLSILRRSTYLTSGIDDTVFGLAIHPLTGEVIAVGTSSTGASTLPGVTGSPQPAIAGLYDAFVSRLTPALDAIPRSTYLGGTDLDQAEGVAVLPSGEIVVVGHTSSTAFATPATSRAIQQSYGGNEDMFVARYTADLLYRTQVTYLGVGGDDQALAVAIAPAEGDIVVAGFSTAAGFPGTASGAPTSYGGNNDAVVVRMSADLTAVNTIPSPATFIAQSNVGPHTVRMSNEIRMANVPIGSANYGSAFVWGQPDSQLCATTTPGCCTNNVPIGQCPGGFYSGWTSQPYPFLEAGDYLAVRHTAAASGTAVTYLTIGGKAFAFVTSTGDASKLCNLDLDADHQLRSNVEGVVLLRAMLGMTGTALVAGTGVASGDWLAIRPVLNAYCGTSFE